MKKYLKNFWFLMLLVAIFAVVFVLDMEKGKVAFLKSWMPYLIALNMFLMSFSLRPEMIVKGALNYKGQAFAFVTSYAVIPALAFVAGRLFFSDNPGLFVGIIIASAVPTTLASASIWTRLSGGNDGFSMVFTIISNFAGVVVTPLIIAFVLQNSIKGDMPVEQIILKLVYILVIPVTLGQVIRLFAGKFPEKAKPVTSNICQLTILMVVFISVANANCRISDGCNVVSVLFTLSLAVGLVHTIAFFVCYFGGRLIKIDRPDAIALAFAGSQKTLMLGVYIAAFFASLPCFSGDEYSLIAFPMIFFHAVQLVVDVVFIELFKRNKM